MRESNKKQRKVSSVKGTEKYDYLLQRYRLHWLLNGDKLFVVSFDAQYKSGLWLKRKVLKLQYPVKSLPIDLLQFDIVRLTEPFGQRIYYTLTCKLNCSRKLQCTMTPRGYYGLGHLLNTLFTPTKTCGILVTALINFFKKFGFDFGDLGTQDFVWTWNLDTTLSKQ